MSVKLYRADLGSPLSCLSEHHSVPSLDPVSWRKPEPSSPSYECFRADEASLITVDDQTYEGLSMPSFVIILEPGARFVSPKTHIRRRRRRSSSDSSHRGLGLASQGRSPQFWRPPPRKNDIQCCRSTQKKAQRCRIYPFSSKLAFTIDICK